MKNLYIIILLFGIFLYSCNNSSSTIDNSTEEFAISDEDIIQENEIETNVDEVLEEVEEEDILKFNVLYDIPEYWTQITETDTGDIIYNPCFVQNPSISIQYPNYEKNDFQLYVGIGQDAVIMKIVDIENSNADRITLINEKGSRIHFSWIDKAKGISSWEVPEVITAKFTDKKHLSNYIEVNEECDDEW